MIPDRFKKEAKIMFLIALALIIFGVLASLFVPWISRQLDIDSCLDGGGKYDYENNKCISNSDLTCRGNIMSIADIISLCVNKKIDPVDIAVIKYLWELFAWFMTYFTPPIIVVFIAYRFGKKTFTKEKEHDRQTLLLLREHEFLTKRYITDGLDKISSCLDWYLSHYNSNHSIATEVKGRCKTERTSKKDDLEDLTFKPIDMLHDLSPFVRINNLVGDNVYHLLMQLVHARTETYYYSRCLDILDLGKHILKNRDSSTKKEYNASLEELEILKESETDAFYRFHSIPYSLLRVTDALEKSMIQGEPMSDFRGNKIVKEEVQNMEKLFSNELKQYERYRIRGSQLTYLP